MLNTVGTASDGISRSTGTVIMRSYCFDEESMGAKLHKNLIVYLS
jgi:hypothetical protein